MPRILAVSGSLRRDSFNTRLLKAIEPLAPEGMELERYEGLAEVPLFNEDVDTDPALPAVARWREAIRRADGIVIATPEYNNSIPGVLKNAVDWASRPHGRGTLTGKGVCVLVATLGRVKGFRCLSDTSRILSGLGNLVIAEPEVVVSSAPSALVTRPDGGVRLTDGTAAALITIQLEALADVIKTQAATAARESIERNQLLLHRLQFYPYVVRALAEGATDRTVVERLTAAGLAPGIVTEWLAEARDARRH
ncbi:MULTISPECIES: NADPH-dependent FMN reductase [unclassified Streptomyces]|uniref:NADPH-dependent FMN reductase n=1 Tax=unclassified Streptomyces TaxID=2593676 RepID=UPI00278C8423|nr:MULTISPECIES: NADPH-dependent FMN reductase [unclassified Streptomyces]